MPAVERLLQHFRSVRGYFLLKSSPPTYLKTFFEHELSEAYLGFILNVGTALNTVIKKLECEETLIVDMYSLMDSLRRSLILKKNEEFYGSIAIQLLRKCDNASIVAQFRREADLYLQKVIDYLEQWFDFNESIFKHLQCLDVKRTCTYKKLLIIWSNGLTLMKVFLNTFSV
nr:PREDICTED: uncharacterized protein LOC107399095 [Tribolium castaneum]|eukprot:XP_015840260.1 PREDICTED: uncharacterized protein LOC107399095 [Tribolium castaneum]